MKKRIAVLFVLAMLPWAGLYAQQAGTAAFRVSATVVESCDMTVSGAASGNHATPGGAPHRARILLRATCSPDATYAFGLRKGMSPAPMIDPWKVTGVGTGEEVDHELFRGVPASQVVPPADQADTMTVRVYY